jgi:hypothetical protein
MLIAATLPLMSASTIAFADDAPVMAPFDAPSFDDAGTPHSVSKPIASDTPTPSVATSAVTCRNDFWVASSYRCRQSCSKCCVCGNLDYIYADGCQLHPRDQPSFHNSLQPGSPVCIVVHGSFVEADVLSEILTGGGMKDSANLIEENMSMYRWIRDVAPERPMNVVFYAWPSDAPITYVPHADVAILGRRSSFNALYLADLISSISEDHPVCLVGHSHGARMVAAALHLLAGGEVQGHQLCHAPAHNPRIRTVLLAGALDHHWLVPGQRYGMALYRTEALVNVRNDHDFVLNAYPFRRLFSHRALGESGVTRRDRWALGAMNARLAEMDVTPLIGRGHLWQHYCDHSEIACALRPYFYFDETAAASAAQPDSSVRQTGGTLRAVRRSKRDLATTHFGVKTVIRGGRTAWFGGRSARSDTVVSWTVFSSNKRAHPSSEESTAFRWRRPCGSSHFSIPADRGGPIIKNIAAFMGCSAMQS